MSNLWFGKKVKLMGLSATKLYYGDEGEKFICHGYVVGSVRSVEVERFIGGDTIIGSDGNLYSLKPEFDSDFYAIVIEDKSEEEINGR